MTIKNGIVPAKYYEVSYKKSNLITNLLSLLGKIKKHPTALIGMLTIIAYILMAVFAPFISPYSVKYSDLSARLLPPVWSGGTWAHPLGTDQVGRDLLTQIIYGSRISILVGFLTVLISASIGTFLGAIAGYYRGTVDTVISRFADFLLSFPFLIFAVGVMAVLGPGFWNLILALTFKSWVEFFRLVRGEVLEEKNKEYVEAAQALGRSNGAIIVSEILPNIFQSIFVLATLRMGYMIIMEASLSYLGLGVPPDIPTWGSLINSGRDHIFDAYWISTLPGIALVILVLSINLFGEGLRDILDPRLKVEGSE
ncbi:MAG: ABC-type dipeptide/oligopeptide/nickel transport system permease component [Caldanaerobacter subterraneus]|nr:MAG: ABC-type dipeptide/oligopeptide/nickel transport system permease component [Caldanaerobacter subterraneus]HAA80050.1 peptide ABC transporter permease [Thermoanaerobacter sp.]